MAAHSVALEPVQRRQELLTRLDDPQTVEGLHKLLDRLDLMNFAFDAADGFFRRGDVIADSLGDSLGELKHLSVPVDARGVAEKLPELLHTGVQLADVASKPAFKALLASGLLERLGDPATIESLHGVLDHLDLPALGLKSVDELLRRSDTIGDSITDSVNDLKKTVPAFDLQVDLKKIKELAEAVPVFLDVALEVRRSGLLEQARSLMQTVRQLHDSGVLGEDAVTVVGELGAAAAATYHKKEYAAATPKGFFGLLSALRDPNVQAALGFGIAVARNYGRNLRTLESTGR